MSPSRRRPHRPRWLTAAVRGFAPRPSPPPHVPRGAPAHYPSGAMVAPASISHAHCPDGAIFARGGSPPRPTAITPAKIARAAETIKIERGGSHLAAEPMCSYTSRPFALCASLCSKFSHTRPHTPPAPRCAHHPYTRALHPLPRSRRRVSPRHPLARSGSPLAAPTARLREFVIFYGI